MTLFDIIKNYDFTEHTKVRRKCWSKDGYMIFYKENGVMYMKYFNKYGRAFYTNNMEINDIFADDYEYFKNVLDSGEKKYLRYIIRPYLYEYSEIVVTKITTISDTYRINIRLTNGEKDYFINLPPFEKNSSMYINMQPDVEYSLKELDLF